MNLKKKYLQKSCEFVNKKHDIKYSVWFLNLISPEWKSKFLPPLYFEESASLEWTTTPLLCANPSKQNLANGAPR